jgi:hypothetical protein
MATPVADRSSNKNEQIVHAAEVLGRSRHRAAVFKAIYRGKRAVKTVVELMKVTKLSNVRVLQLGRQLADNDLVEQVKVAGGTGYRKVEFIKHYRDRILKAAANRKVRDAIPTKRSRHAPAGKIKWVSVGGVRLPQKFIRATRITVDDIDSFSAVRKVPDDQDYIKIAEATFKRGVAKILGQRGTFKDWGGELSDLSSTNLVIKGKRRSAAFAFKGPGKSGILTPAKLGKNGDQIQRLARCPADVFIVQYWQQIHDHVVEQLEQFVRLKSALENRQIWYGVIDGQDSARLILAYPKEFDRN